MRSPAKRARWDSEGVLDVKGWLADRHGAQQEAVQVAQPVQLGSWTKRGSAFEFGSAAGVLKPATAVSQQNISRALHLSPAAAMLRGTRLESSPGCSSCTHLLARPPTRNAGLLPFRLPRLPLDLNQGREQFIPKVAGDKGDVETVIEAALKVRAGSVERHCGERGLYRGRCRAGESGAPLTRHSSRNKWTPGLPSSQMPFGYWHPCRQAPPFLTATSAPSATT